MQWLVERLAAYQEGPFSSEVARCETVKCKTIAVLKFVRWRKLPGERKDDLYRNKEIFKTKVNLHVPLKVRRRASSCSCERAVKIVASKQKYKILRRFFRKISRRPDQQCFSCCMCAGRQADWLLLQILCRPAGGLIVTTNFVQAGSQTDGYYKFCAGRQTDWWLQQILCRPADGLMVTANFVQAGKQTDGYSRF